MLDAPSEERDWRRLVDRCCPLDQELSERHFRLPPTSGDGGDLRSGLHVGLVTRQYRCTVPRYVCAWVLRGTGRFRSGSGDWQEFSPGSCFQRLPDCVHDIHFDDPQRGAYWFVGLPPSFCAGLAAVDCDPAGAVVIEPGRDARLLRRALAYHRQLAVSTEEDLPLAQAEAFALVSELHRRHHRRRALAAAPWLDRARELLASDAHSVAAVASACGLGLSAFRAQFRRATGVSPLRWRIRRRMRRAQHLLLAGRPLAQVAQQLGYPSVQGFSRQFGQWTGLPPGRWLARQEESSGG